MIFLGGYWRLGLFAALTGWTSRFPPNKTARLKPTFILRWREANFTVIELLFLFQLHVLNALAKFCYQFLLFSLLLHFLEMRRLKILEIRLPRVRGRFKLTALAVINF